MNLTKKELICLVIGSILALGAMTLIITGNSLLLVTNSRTVRVFITGSFMLNSMSIFYGGLAMSQIYKGRSAAAISKSFNTQACGVLFSVISLFLAFVLYI